METMTKDEKLCDDLLQNICLLVNKFIFHHAIKYSIENMMEHVRLALHNISEEKKISFYSMLARELVKFYMAPENKNWIEINKIPLSDPLFTDELLSWLALSRKLTVSLNDHPIRKGIEALEKAIMQINVGNPKKTQYISYFSHLPPPKTYVSRFFHLVPPRINEEKNLIDTIKIIFEQRLKTHLEGFYYLYKISPPRISNIYDHLLQFIEKQTENFNFAENPPALSLT